MKTFSKNGVAAHQELLRAALAMLLFGAHAKAAAAPYRGQPVFNIAGGGLEMIE